MSHVLNRAVVALTAVAVAAGTALVGAPAQAAVTSVTSVRPADLILVPGTVSGTTGTARADFLAEGIHIKTTNNTDAARGYWKTNVKLADVHAVEYEWFGSHPTTPPSNYGEPALFYNIDIDGDGKPDGQLVGELAYGGTEVWLNRDSQEFAGVTPTQPAGTFAALAPCDNATQRAGATDTCTPPFGTGAQYHGSLNDWQRRIAGAGKTGNIVSAGYLAFGLIYDGVLRSATIGPNQYNFTNAAKSTVAVTAKAKHDKVKKAQKVKISGTVKPVGPGAQATLELKKGGKWTALKSKVLPAAGNFGFSAKPDKLGKLRYRVTVAETNNTAAAKSKTVKVLVTKK